MVSLLAATLVFSPLRLGGCVLWFYLCLYCIEYSQHYPWMAQKNRRFTHLLMLIAGPLVIFTLYVTYAARQTAAMNGNLFDFFEILTGRVKKIVTIKDNTEYPIKLLDMHGRGMASVLAADSQDRQIGNVLKTTENLVRHALLDNASDILVTPTNDGYHVRLRIDGMMSPLDELEYNDGLAVVSSIKAISGLDIAEKRRPQDGMFSALTPDGNVSFRVNSTGVLNGEKVSIRVLSSMCRLGKIENLGISAEEQKIIRSTLQRQNGMILVCGPTGSGKSTTIHAMLRTIDCQLRNVITIEDPIEYVLPDASQIEINPKADITFASALRSVMRQDPDVISIGEIRDQETAAIALQASQTGHLVLATLHSNSNLSTVVRLLDFGIKPLLLASSLDIVISQRLLRQLCPDCKAPAKLSRNKASTLSARGIDPTVVMGPVGCPKCNQSGYRGRTGIFDLLVIDNEMKNLLSLESFTRESLMDKYSHDHRNRLQKRAIRLLLNQQTSLDEIKRIITNVG